ncbi:lytic transglycosylase domain-containing protein [Pseudomonas caspiana]|nr:transglycosylase SLT domain-containing protein [Pseudomonas caspiana]TPG90329.1 lytic transglycosylase domain-containing protein [Pseudomonas caspiana]
MVTTVESKTVLFRLVSCGALLDPTPCAIAQAAQVPPPAYSIAARQAGIPSNILFAVALQESGLTLRRQRRPWPWTLNVAGAAHYYSTHRDACLGLLQAMKRHPATRIDAGLTQINLGYQKRFYRFPCEVLSPHKNLAIAATLLREHYRTDGNWLDAAGRFHRPAGGPLAARYRLSVSHHLRRIVTTGSYRP